MVDSVTIDVVTDVYKKLTNVVKGSEMKFLVVCVEIWRGSSPSQDASPRRVSSELKEI